MLIDLIQYDFSHGEISPKMLARTDLRIYKKAAKQIRNAVVIPQGGVRRRFGTDYVTRWAMTDVEECQGTELKYNDEKKFTIMFFDEEIEILLDGVLKATVTSPYTGAMLKANQVKFAHARNKLIIVHDTVHPKILKRGADDTTWTLTDVDFKNLPAYDFEQNYDDITFKLSSVDVGKGRALTTDSPLFSADYVGGIFIAMGDDLATTNGFARITAFVNDSEVTVDITSKFNGSIASGSDGVIGSNCFLGESAWNDTRGYPKSVTFYEGRLVFGATTELPGTLFMSVSEDIFNFDIGTSQPSDAIQVTLEGIYSIVNVVGDLTLQVFTDEAEFATLQLEGQSLQPENAAIRKQSGYGSEILQPVTLDNQTLYVKRGGKGIMSFGYENTRNGYSSTEITLLNPELISNPQNMAVFKGSQTEDANYLFIVNDDGTLTVFQTLAVENISSLSQCFISNQGADEPKYRRVFTVNNEIYFITEREIDGSTYGYLEKLNFVKYSDCCLEKTLSPAGTTVTGLDIFEGLEVTVKGDGYVLDNETVSGGEITISRESTDVIVGLPYYPTLELLPLFVESQNGNNMYKNKRVVSIYVDYYQSLGIKVGDIDIPYLEFGGTFPYGVPDPESGVYEITVIDGWDARQTITITQDDPLPMTILAVGYVLEI